LENISNLQTLNNESNIESTTEIKSFVGAIRSGLQTHTDDSEVIIPPINVLSVCVSSECVSDVR
jgi:hypothetical protein